MSTPFSVSEPFPVFQGSDGSALEDGYIYIGAANLDPQTNPVLLYWDSALSISAVQPLRTINGYISQNGTPSKVYVNADDYSIRVCDKTNSLIYSALTSVGSIPFSCITGQVPGDRVNFLAAGALAVTRTAQAKMRDAVSVFDYMTPDQIADVQARTLTYDVTVPIQNAIDAAQDVYFPEGTYKITASLTVLFSIGKTLRGAGKGKTIIKNEGTGPGITSTGNGFIGNFNIRICDLAIQGRAGTTFGILCTYTFFSTIERVALYSCGSDGLRVDHCSTVDISSVHSYNNTGCGICFGPGSLACNVNGGEFVTNTFDGILITAEGSTAPLGVSVVGAHIAFNTGCNVELIDAYQCNFVNCRIETSTGYATTKNVYIRGTAGTSDNVVLSNCSLSGNNATSTLTSLEVYQATDTIVENCVINGSTTVNLLSVRTKFINTTQTVLPNDLSASTSFYPPKAYTCATLPVVSPGLDGRIAYVFDVALAHAWGVAVLPGEGGGALKYMVVNFNNAWTVMGK